VKTELPKHYLSLLIPSNQVENRILQMGNRITRDLTNDNPVVIAIKEGGVTFDNKISKVLYKNNYKFDRGVLGVSSYGNGTESNRSPKVTVPLNVDVAGRKVIVNEDIVDTGETMAFVIDLLIKSGASSVLINTLLWKPSREIIKVPIYQNGFEIPDKFVVGEGIDWADNYRTKCGIWVVNMLVATV